MNSFLDCFWIEILKARRSKLWMLVLAGFTILPLVSGLFMIILKDPEKAREMGLISMKAQLTAGVADWPSMFGMPNMGIGVAGMILFAIITTWVFGREFFNHTTKELLAVPIPRSTILATKFLLIFIWTLLIAIYVYLLGLAIGALVDIPGWSPGLAWNSFKSLMLATVLTTLLMSWVAFFASAGRGYLPPLGWAFFAMATANIMGVLGWGEWYPWTVPVLLGEMLGPNPDPLGPGSYLSVIIASVVGLLATFTWWRRADQA